MAYPILGRENVAVDKRDNNWALLGISLVGRGRERGNDSKTPCVGKGNGIIHVCIAPNYIGKAIETNKGGGGVGSVGFCCPGCPIRKKMLGAGAPNSCSVHLPSAGTTCPQSYMAVTFSPSPILFCPIRVLPIN